nr:hypothetical protein [Enterococcus gilvus]
MMYKSVIVEKGAGGWGTPLTITPKEGQKIVSITGGSIHPVAQRIAELTGAPVVDGFKHPVADKEIACAVIDCGGVSRVGVLPKKGILTININGGGPSGPLARFIKEGVFVSGVKDKNVTLVD